MKCQNMKTVDILFFIANFITIYSSNIRQYKTSQMTTEMGEEVFKNLSRDCPQILEMMQEYKDFVLNCKELTSEKPNTETVLQYSCFIVRDMLSFICDTAKNMTAFSLKQNTVDFINCPFNFSHLEKLGIKFSHNDLAKEFTLKDHCEKVCNDLFSARNQCVILNAFNNYLKTIPLRAEAQKNLVPQDVGEHQIQPEQVKTDTITQKTENTIINTKDAPHMEKSGPLIKTQPEKTISKPIDSDKAVLSIKVENKTEKQEAITSTPKKEQPLESEIKNIASENLLPDGRIMNEPEEEPLNEDDISEIDFPHPGLKQEEISAPSIPKIEEKISLPSPEMKNVYSPDRFFQAEDSHFFFYFIMVSSIIVVGYLAFHNKNKILAYALEGTSGRRSRRRPNPARYRKLETNLEEVISSNSTNMAASSVVY